MTKEVESWCFLSTPAVDLLLLLALLVRRVLVRTQIPCADQIALGGIDLALLLDVLNAYPQAILCEDHILLAHFLRDIAPHPRDTEIDLVADPSSTGGKGTDDEERNELTEEDSRKAQG